VPGGAPAKKVRIAPILLDKILDSCRLLLEVRVMKCEGQTVAPPQLERAGSELRAGLQMSAQLVEEPAKCLKKFAASPI
jgi:hypothetical protein